ncbi:hypothetical protein QBC46DRAFT_403722 [Diplogelasinospora grovesii]|uniref:Uncharacterized protein n=1 Tax=Diplogelasinospora grovesii TaxID=303347 RepID=A0AAN6NJX3_9PEZI|nr:hypothetical protein QBC46DRAFT_403722 [Diplogelasinospora grovesii]
MSSIEPVSSQCQSQSCLDQPQPQAQQQSEPQTRPASSDPHTPSSRPSNSKPSSSRRSTLPFSFPPLFFQPNNTSSTSLAPSTAEGRPIPLDDSIAAHRTSALQKLNSTYPSSSVRGGHRYVKSTGAQSSTYSQPVIVRTYSGPSPSSHTSYNAHSGTRYGRPSSSSRGVSRRVPLPPSSSRPIKPALSGIGIGSASAGAGTSNGTTSTGNNGTGSILNQTSSMPRHHKAKKSSSGSTAAGSTTSKLSLPLQLPLPLPWQWPSASSRAEPGEAKLPPLEAFSFKSFMADMQAQGAESDIGADLDRIAEICARSRYSLSNQYEVHVAPHGSGVGFLSGGGSSTSSSGARRKGHSHSHGGGGPTLQAINSDDDESRGGSHHSGKRRNAGGGGRRRSVAYGTLETIMSSSRSSEEEKTKKKSAAEIAEEVRGRAARKYSNPTTESGGSGSGLSTTTGEAGSHDTTAATQGEGSGGSSSQQQQGSTSGGGAKPKPPRSQRSASFASAALLKEGTHAGQKKETKPASTRPGHMRSASARLVSQPALPQTSNSHLEIRTSKPDYITYTPRRGTESPQSGSSSERQLEVHFADELPHGDGDPSSSGKGPGSAAGWTAWIPWRGATTQTQGGGDGGEGTQSSTARPSHPSHAEGSLRQLLNKTAGGETSQKAPPSTR